MVAILPSISMVTYQVVPWLLNGTLHCLIKQFIFIAEYSVPSTWEAEAGDLADFGASLVYIDSSRTRSIM